MTTESTTTIPTTTNDLNDDIMNQSHLNSLSTSKEEKRMNDPASLSNPKISNNCHISSNNLNCSNTETKTETKSLNQNTIDTKVNISSTSSKSCTSNHECDLQPFTSNEKIQQSIDSSNNNNKNNNNNNKIEIKMQSASDNHHQPSSIHGHSPSIEIDQESSTLNTNNNNVETNERGSRVDKSPTILSESSATSTLIPISPSQKKNGQQQQQQIADTSGNMQSTTSLKRNHSSLSSSPRSHLSSTTGNHHHHLHSCKRTRKSPNNHERKRKRIKSNNTLSFSSPSSTGKKRSTMKRSLPLSSSKASSIRHGSSSTRPATSSTRSSKHCSKKSKGKSNPSSRFSKSHDEYNRHTSSNHSQKSIQSIVHNLMEHHIPCPSKSHWTTTYEANDPCEDRFASLSNVFITPVASTSSSSSSSSSLAPLIRMSLFTVLDGHGGAAVAEHASKHLLPLLARNICTKLQCKFVHSGQYNVNGHSDYEQQQEQQQHQQQKKSNRGVSKTFRIPKSIRGCIYSDDDDDDDDNDHEIYDDDSVMTNDENDNPIIYTLDENCFLVQNEHEDSEEEEEEDMNSDFENNLEPWYKAPDCFADESEESSEDNFSITEDTETSPPVLSNGDDPNLAAHTNTVLNQATPNEESNVVERLETKPLRSVSDDSTTTTTTTTTTAQKQQEQPAPQVTDSSSSSSCDSSTASSTNNSYGPTNEDNCTMDDDLTDLTSTIQKTFIEFDEEWMNSIDPINTKQSFLVHNGAWNAGSCCLVVAVLQPLKSSVSKVPTTNNNKKTSGMNNDLVVDATNDIDDQSCCCDDDDLSFCEEEEEDVCKKYLPGKALMYTAHVGDCRAMLIRNKMKRRSTLHEEDEDDYNSDSDVDDDDQENIITRTSARKSLFISTSSNKKRRRSCSWDDSDSEDESSLPPSYTKSNHDFEPSPLSHNLNFVTLTKDHTPYNLTEEALVRQRCKNAPIAIGSSVSGGIKRVAGSLSVTRALGDAYLKTPILSFEPFKKHAPFITALPEVRSRIIGDGDRVLFLASDGVWERINEENVKNCIAQYYKNQNKVVESPGVSSSSSYFSIRSTDSKMSSSSSSNNNIKKHRIARMRMLPTRSSWEETNNCYNNNILSKTKVSDAIVSSVLHKVKKKHKMRSIKNVMALPKGSCRRSKHDDITNMVIDLEGYIF